MARHFRKDRECRRGVYLLPNLFTMANMLGGFYSIIATLNNDFVKAAVAIIICVVLDGIDGKIARLTNTCSEFGVEFDSLADVISFGVAPALLVYIWVLKPFGRIGWLAAFLFLACGGLRLARFNVQHQTVQKTSFRGLPIPAAAGVIAATVLFINDTLGHVTDIQHAIAIAMGGMVYVLAFLMVSPFKYASFKPIVLRDKRPFEVLVAVLLFLIIIMIKPIWAIMAFFSVYALSGLIGSKRFIRNAFYFAKQKDREVET